MTLTVLMSVYKNESVSNLNSSLCSIWTGQSEKPDQIVLVEDGPLSSGLYAVVENWKSIIGQNFCVVKNKKNLGLAASLNNGLNYVTGELVARQDSDDYSFPERFKLQKAYLESHKDIDILGGSVEEVDENGNLLCVRHYPNKNIRQYICKASPLAHPSAVMKMRIFNEGGLKYNTACKMNEDISLWFDALCSGCKISNIDETVYRFFCSSSMYKRRSREKAWPEFKVYIGGIKRLYGMFTWRYIFPVSRLVFRYMPVDVISLVYKSKIRHCFLGK